MTDDEVKRMLERIRRNGQYEYVSRAYDSTFRRAERMLDKDDEQMEERPWIKRAFMQPPVYGEEQRTDRHPRTQMRFTTYPVGKSRRIAERMNTRYGDIYGWVMDNSTTQKAPSEIEAGDTSALDDFLGGFANAKK